MSDDFLLASGEETQIIHDVSECEDGTYSQIIYFGNKITKTSNRHLKLRQKVQLQIIDVVTGAILADSHDGHLKSNDTIILTAPVGSTTIFALNMINRGKKTSKLRIRGTSSE